MDLNELFASESVQIKKLEDLVKNSLKEEALLSSKLVELEKDDAVSFGQKVSDKVASFGGSWTFIISFSVFIFIWMGINIFVLATHPFDPYPFVFLNLILSCIAALQAPVIMMSQNRQEDKDRRRARSDYLINLKSELEIRGLHSKVDMLIAEEMKTLFKVQQSQMDMLTEIKAHLERDKERGQQKNS